MRISLAKLKEALRPTIEVIRTAAFGYARDNASLFSAGVAFWAVLSLSPVLVFCVMVISFVFDDTTARGHMIEWIDLRIGGQVGSSIIRALENASAPGATTIPGLISLCVMFWSATRLFHALQMALNHIWNVRTKSRHNLGRMVLHLLKKRALTFLLLLSLAILILVSLALGTVMPVVTQLMEELPGWWFFYRVMELTISGIIISIGVGLVYMILPDARIPWRFVWRGALLTGILMVIGKLILGWYLSRSNMSSYGAAGSIAALLIWVYFSTQVFFFGAELTQAYAHVVSWPQEPEPIAERVDPVKKS